MTQLPQRRIRTSERRESQPPTVAIALFVGFVLAAAFTGLAAVVIPGVLLMVLAGLGMLVFFVLQYFLWAKWLYPIVLKMEPESSTATDATKPLPDRIPPMNQEPDP